MEMETVKLAELKGSRKIGHSKYDPYIIAALSMPNDEALLVHGKSAQCVAQSLSIIIKRKSLAMRVIQRSGKAYLIHKEE